MQNLTNIDIDKWQRPWDIEKFNELYNRDERFFSVIIKGALMWLNNNMKMYGRPIKHFIFNTGSSYMYLEENGYEYKWCETTGEDMLYMEMPRCIVTIGNFSIPLEELSQGETSCIFERISHAKETDGQILAYNAKMKRMPLEITLNLKYVFGTFNESIIYIQELFEKFAFQQYYNTIYLGQVIQNSMEFVSDTNIEFNNIDLTSKDVNQKTIQFDIKINTNLPIIDERSQIPVNKIISKPTGAIYKSPENIKLADYET